MTKSADAFRTISEVADWLNTPAHVLRFWESKFNQVKPVKRAGGRRYYRPTDMKLLGGIKRLLHDDGMTIKGVQKLLREQGVAHVAGLSQPLGDAADDEETAGVLIEAEAIPVKETAPVTAELTPETASEPQEQEAARVTETFTHEKVAEETAVSSEAADSQADQPSTSQDPVATEAAEPTLSFSHRMADAPEVTPESESTDESAEQSQPEAAVLPSFLNRRRSDEDAPAATDSAPTGEATAPRPAIEMPDLPADAEDDVPAEPGVLAALSRLPRKISPELAQEFERIATALRARGATGGRQ